MANYETSALTSYVEVNKDVLVKNIVLGLAKGDSIRNFRKQTGIKKTERLNYLNVAPVIQDGAGCSFNPAGSTSFSERDITVSEMKSQDNFCDDLLRGKFAEYLVKTAANKDASDMPFEQVILDEVVEGLNEQLEKLVWQGATSGNSGTDLIDGILTQALNDDSASTIFVTGSSATSMYARVQAVIMAIPEDWLDKAVIFLSPANYRKLIFELMEKNLYHYPVGAEIEDNEVYFPGTEIAIHRTQGLKGANEIVCSAWENLVYGTDLENDMEKIRFWYDDNSELFKYSIHWMSGVKTLFPDAVIVGDFSA